MLLPREIITFDSSRLPDLERFKINNPVYYTKDNLFVMISDGNSEIRGCYPGTFQIDTTHDVSVLTRNVFQTESIKAVYEIVPKTSESRELLEILENGNRLDYLDFKGDFETTDCSNVCAVHGNNGVHYYFMIESQKVDDILYRWDEGMVYNIGNKIHFDLMLREIKELHIYDANAKNPILCINLPSREKNEELLITYGKESRRAVSNPNYYSDYTESFKETIDKFRVENIRTNFSVSNPDILSFVEGYNKFIESYKGVRELNVTATTPQEVELYNYYFKGDI